MSGSIDIMEDRPPYVRFERRAVENKDATKREGRWVGKDVDFVLITPAYTKDKIVREVAPWFEKLEGDARNNRIPSTWIPKYKAQYAAWQNGQELPAEGTPIRGWGVISPALQELLISQQILTVEDAAGMNEDAIRRTGMAGNDIRNKARAHLKAAKDTGHLVLENSELRQKLDLAERNVATLAEQVKTLAARLDSGDRFHVEQSAAPTVEIADVLPDEDDDINARYTAKFGKPPHHRMKPESIRAALEG